MNEAHVGWDSFLASQCDPPEAFEFVEETFDLMALFVDRPVDRRRDGSGRIGLDLRFRTELFGDEAAQPIRITGCIGELLPISWTRR